MSPIETSAIYIIGAIILSALTGLSWLLAIGGLLALSAIARHLYTKEQV
ncbi:hypothetical protein ACXM2N_04365 [Corynebacterium sp. ZY180755]